MMQAQGELSLEGPSLYALSVEMGKAFDTVRREHLIIMIEKVSGRKSDVKRMTKLHPSDIELTVKMGKGSSRGSGTPHGDGISLVFYILPKKSRRKADERGRRGIYAAEICRRSNFIRKEGNCRKS